jgi:hypothetical protein
MFTLPVILEYCHSVPQCDEAGSRSTGSLIREDPR